MTATGHQDRVPRRLAVLAALPFVAAAALTAGAYTAVRDRLPAELAVHFGPGGKPDGFESATGFLLSILAMLLLGGALWTAWVVRTARGGKAGTSAAAAGGWGIAAFLGWIAVTLVHLNADAARSADVRLPFWHIGVALVIGGVVGYLGHTLVKRVVPEGPPGGGSPGAERLDLPRAGRAGWARSTSSWPMLLGGTVTLLAAALPLALPGLPSWVAIVVLLSGALLVLMAQAEVTVDRRGLVVRPSGLPWPRLRVPLERVASAEARSVDPLGEFGGWGYRVTPKRSGLIYRSGEALVVRKTGDGREFAVTVADAGTAAALLNTLADRRPENR